MKASILLLIACGLSSTFAANKLTDEELKDIGDELTSAIAQLQYLQEHHSDPNSEEVVQVSKTIETLMDKLQNAGDASLGQGES